MKIQWNKVTWYSKGVAIVLFVATFFLGMWIGMQYQYALDQYVTANMDMQRTPLFINHGSFTNQKCGGFINNAPDCPANYHCVLGSVPDKGGVCVHD
ncbi:MAG TPA: hypothetical protein VMV71_02600 [Candidatus Paceibacterota bacterium]|nr:hypothetical protein [Candidatus Paceibacterota bacterium]